VLELATDRIASPVLSTEDGVTGRNADLDGRMRSAATEESDGGNGMASRLISCLVAAVAIALLPVAGAAQDEPPDGWSFKGELSSVLSSGNSEAFTLGLGAVIQNKWGPNRIRLEAGSIRTESTIITRRAVGTATSWVVEEDEDRQKTAEVYFARARYDRSVSEHFFLFGGTDWLRNTFAGVDSRFLVALGAGNTWRDDDRSRFKTDYAFTYTFQSDVVENPFLKTSFPGVRASWDYWRQATETTEFESQLTGDLNLDETEDIRLDFTNSLNVAVSSSLALKPSLQLLWRNLPSLAEVDLFSQGGTPLNEKVRTPLDKLDLFFKLALVVTL
jgi:hypothetical protein